ncbi:MAG: hypothetical protein ACI3X6_07340, partial [Alloprevotella sp.]
RIKGYSCIWRIGFYSYCQEWRQLLTALVIRKEFDKESRRMNTDIQKLIGEATAYDKKQMLEVKRPKSWFKSVSALYA